MASCGWCGLDETDVVGYDLFRHIKKCRLGPTHCSACGRVTAEWQKECAWRELADEATAEAQEQLAALLALRDSLGHTRVRSTLVVSVAPGVDTRGLWVALDATLKLFDGEVLELEISDGL